MFKSITWGEYLHYLFIVVSVYYLVVLTIYFGREIAQLIRRGRLRQDQYQDPGGGESTPIDSA